MLIEVFKPEFFMSHLGVTAGEEPPPPPPQSMSEVKGRKICCEGGFFPGDAWTPSSSVILDPLGLSIAIIIELSPINCENLNDSFRHEIERALT